MPFGKAGQLLQDLLGVSCSKATARRITQGAGAAYVAIQSEAADQIVQQAPPAKAGMEKALLSIDGATIPLIGGEWAEVKTLA